MVPGKFEVFSSLVIGLIQKSYIFFFYFYSSTKKIELSMSIRMRAPPSTQFDLGFIVPRYNLCWHSIDILRKLNMAKRGKIGFCWKFNSSLAVAAAIVADVLITILTKSDSEPFPSFPSMTSMLCNQCDTKRSTCL